MTLADPKYHSQGTLDGLCGHYAIINALTECGITQTWDEKQKAFKSVFKRAPKIYDGMTFADMKRYFKKPHPAMRGILTTYPFEKHGQTPKRNAGEYFNQLVKLLSLKRTVCAIIQIQRATDSWEEHWIVVKRFGNRLQFIDSIDQRDKDYIYKNRSSINVTKQRNRRSAGREWHLIERRQTILFKREPTRVPDRSASLSNRTSTAV